MKRQKILKISSVNYSGELYNIELKSNDPTSKDDLFWVEQNSKIISHNCFPKDVKSFIHWCDENRLNSDLLQIVDMINERVRENKDWYRIKGATTENNFE